MYRIELTPKAEEELRALGRSGDKASINKVYRLFEELRVHPYEGTVKPEPLVGDYAGYWSRRINQKDRLIYRVKDEIITVTVVQVGQHYKDK